MNDNIRKSISATVHEIVEGHNRFHIPIDEGEFCEAYGIIIRIEKAMLHEGQGVLD